jgi:hypothetical protein
MRFCIKFFSDSNDQKEEEKSREEIQAEREAKKQAKAVAKKKTDTKGSSAAEVKTVQPIETNDESKAGSEAVPMEVDADEKSREAIKAEREAKKLAKAAAKQGNKAKVEPSTKAESVKVENTESEKPDQVKIRHETFHKSKVMLLS